MGRWVDFYNAYVPIDPITDNILVTNAIVNSHVEDKGDIPLVTMSDDYDVLDAMQVTYMRLISRRIPEKTHMGLHELLDLSTHDFKVIVDICTKEVADEAEAAKKISDELEEQLQTKNK